MEALPNRICRNECAPTSLFRRCAAGSGEAFEEHIVPGAEPAATPPAVTALSVMIGNTN